MQKRRGAELIHTFGKKEYVIEMTPTETHLIIVTNKGVYLVSLDDKPTFSIVTPTLKRPE